MRYCEKMTKHLEEKKNIEFQEALKSTNIVDKKFNK